MSDEFLVYRAFFLGGTVQAVLTISNRGEELRWCPAEPQGLKGEALMRFELEYHAWRLRCTRDHLRRIGRTLADENEALRLELEKNAPKKGTQH